MSFEHRLGDTVIVEVTGKVVARNESTRGDKYIIQPFNTGLPAIHAPPEHVYAPDEAEVISNVVALPRRAVA